MGHCIGQRYRIVPDGDDDDDDDRDYILAKTGKWKVSLISLVGCSEFKLIKE